MDRDVTLRGVLYPRDLTDAQWGLLEPVFHARGKRGRKHAGDHRRVAVAMLYISQTGCQWRARRSPTGARFLTGYPRDARGMRPERAIHGLSTGLNEQWLPEPERGALGLRDERPLLGRSP
jgi:hypothetical protein